MPTAAQSTVHWENRILTLLREELAPSPVRWRASIRLCVMCVVATALIAAYHIPQGQFLVLMFFLVAMSDAATSRANAASNIIGSLVGGFLGVLALGAFADQPWVFFPLQGAVLAVAMFLMRTTTIPLAMLFAAVSFVIVAPEFLLSSVGSLYGGMRAVVFQACGIGLGTLVQSLWWPEDPARLLLADLGESLRSVEQECARLRSGNAATQPPGRPIRDLRSSAAQLARQLDYLREAEDQDRWLRQRHTEQIQLITDIQRLIFAALELKRELATTVPRESVELGRRLEVLGANCQRIRQSLETLRPPEVPTTPPQQQQTSSNSSQFPSLDEMERLLAELPGTLAFLGTLPESGSVPPTREPIARRQFFTPDFRGARGEAARFGLKAALAASVCGLICQALDWPGIGTCVMTTVLVAQATVGSGRHKAVLRFGGALLAGLAALVVMAVLMPNLQSLASLVVLTAVLTFVAAWITNGSSRTAYLGVQMGVTLYLVLFAGSGPSMELVPARDRLIGILLGIVVMAAIDAVLWPVFTHAALRRKLAALMKSMAELQRCTLKGKAAEVSERAVGIHRGMAEALALQEELIFETTVGDLQAETERRQVMRAMSRLQEVFLGLLATHRLGIIAVSNPASPMTGENADDSIAARLEALADALQRQTGSASELVHREPARVVRPRESAGPSGEREQRRRRLAESVSALERDVLPVMGHSGR